MAGSSRIVEGQMSGLAIDSSSRRSVSVLSGSSSDVSSILESITRGGWYVPVLLSGPTVSDIGEDTATISWELDPDEPNGYHRVRYRETGTEDWTITDFTESASHSAEIVLTSLDSETEYDYQVQSCNIGDGNRAFNFYPEPANTFETTAPAGDIEFSNYEVSKHFFLPLVVVEWDTVPNTKGKLRWRIKDSGDAWVYTNLAPLSGYASSHTHITGMATTPGIYYEFQCYGITEESYEEWDVLKYIKISEAGEPEFED